VNWIVFILIIAALIIWIIFKKRQMRLEAQKLEEWLKFRGLVRYKEDPFGLVTIVDDGEWVMGQDSIYDVIQLQFRSMHYYIFNANKKFSERIYRTYGCILLKIPRHKALFLFSGSSSDLRCLKISPFLKRLDNLNGMELQNLFTIYAEDRKDAYRMISILEPIILSILSGDLIVEARGDNLLILRDEYFTFTEIENSMIIAQKIYNAFY
jgi:hypothetical protein